MQLAELRCCACCLPSNKPPAVCSRLWCPPSRAQSEQQTTHFSAPSAPGSEKLLASACGAICLRRLQFSTALWNPIGARSLGAAAGASTSVRLLCQTDRSTAAVFAVLCWYIFHRRFLPRVHFLTRAFIWLSLSRARVRNHLAQPLHGEALPLAAACANRKIGSS